MKIKEIVGTALFSAIICITAIITVPIGAVPITLSLFGVFTAAALQKPKCAIVSVSVYIIIGVVGLPVFSGFGSGIGYLIGPTGGFIFAYPIAAAIVSAANSLFKKYYVALPVSMVISLAISYLFGAGWYAVVTEVNFTAAVLVCVLPFIVFDIIKIGVCLAVVFAVKKSPIEKLLNG